METLQEQKQNPGASKSFTAQTSTKAIAVVIAAIIAGLALVGIVNANNSNETAAAPETTIAPTTTVVSEDTQTTAPVTTENIADAKDPSDVNVLVLNGSNAAGIAGSVTDALAELNYQTLTAANDSAKGSGTTVYFKNGFEDDARQLASNVLPGVLNNLNIGQEVSVERFPLSAPTTWDQEDLVAANVVVVVGNA